MNELTFEDRGTYDVLTNSSRYRLKLDGEGRSTLHRVTVQGAILRRDEEELPLLAIEKCAVGSRGGFYIDVRGDGVITHRDTTPVVKIEVMASV